MLPRPLLLFGTLSLQWRLKPSIDASESSAILVIGWCKSKHGLVSEVRGTDKAFWKRWIDIDTQQCHNGHLSCKSSFKSCPPTSPIATAKQIRGYWSQSGTWFQSTVRNKKVFKNQQFGPTATTNGDPNRSPNPDGKQGIKEDTELWRSRSKGASVPLCTHIPNSLGRSCQASQNISKTGTAEDYRWFSQQNKLPYYVRGTLPILRYFRLGEFYFLRLFPWITRNTAGLKNSWRESVCKNKICSAHFRNRATRLWSDWVTDRNGCRTSDKLPIKHGEWQVNAEWLWRTCIKSL